MADDEFGVSCGGCRAGRFGYDITIEVLPEPNTYRVLFNQLTMSPEHARQVFGEDAANWIQLATPDWGGPAVRTIQAGEILALDLLTNGETGQKIVDYMTVQMPSSKPPSKLGPWPRDFVYETGTARDFRAEDAVLSLQVEGFDIVASAVDPLTPAKNLQPMMLAFKFTPATPTCAPPHRCLETFRLGCGFENVRRR